MILIFLLGNCQCVCMNTYLKFFKKSYGLTDVPLNSYVEALTPNGMVFGDGR